MYELYKMFILKYLAKLASCQYRVQLVKYQGYSCKVLLCCLCRLYLLFGRVRGK